MAETTYNPVAKTGDISDQVMAALLKKYTLERLRHHCFLTNLVNRDFDSAMAEIGDTIKVPTISGGTVGDHTDGTDLTYQELTHSTQDVVLNKNKIIGLKITSLANLFSRPTFLKDNIDHILGLMVEQQEDDIFALYASFSTNNYTAQGTSGNIADSDFSKINRKLKAARIPKDQKPSLVVSLFDGALVQNEANFVQYDRIGTGQRMIDGTLGTHRGFNIFESTRVPEVSVSAGTQYKNLAFHRNAITFVSRSLNDGMNKPGIIEANISDSMTGQNFTIQTAYDIDAQAYKMVIHALYGVNVLRETFASVVTSVEA